MRRLEFSEELWCDRQPVHAGELQQFAFVPEAGTHDDRLDPVLLVVVEDALNRSAAGIIGRRLKQVFKISDTDDP